MFGIIVAIIAIIAIGIYFKSIFGNNSSRGISCTGCLGCPCCKRRKKSNCSQNKLKNSLLKIYREEDDDTK
ncbi:MAG: hypothetical protein LBB88_06905 [Planctomycetaceae bacterium]|nr:hypothetical protein [Planctomycetaceae bacterium]